MRPFRERYDRSGRLSNRCVTCQTWLSLRSESHFSARLSWNSTDARWRWTPARPLRSSPTSPLSGHVQSRDIIATLLWPEYDGDRSRAALRRTLSTLRTSLGGEWLVSDRGTIGLNLEQAWFDLAEFRRASADPDATAQQLTAAVDLHRGDLLAGFSVRDSAEFDDWQRIAADGVRRELATALDRLVETLAAGGHYDHAVARAEQRLALDPLHEPAHRRLIELYASAGRRGDALAQYRECVRTLDRELGVGPLAETTELYNAVNEGRAPEPMTTAARGAGAVTAAGRP